VLEEALWLLAQQSRALQELRRQVAFIWDDSAARYVNERYLDPHETDDRDLRDALRLQLAALAQAEASLTAAGAFGMEAERLAAEIEDWLRPAAEEQRVADYQYNLCVKRSRDAQDRLPIIKQLVVQANGTCTGTQEPTHG
jgi:hypothetical protein